MTIRREPVLDCPGWGLLSGGSFFPLPTASGWHEQEPEPRTARELERYVKNGISNFRDVNLWGGEARGGPGWVRVNTSRINNDYRRRYARLVIGNAHRWLEYRGFHIGRPAELRTFDDLAAIRIHLEDLLKYAGECAGMGPPTRQVKAAARSARRPTKKSRARRKWPPKAQHGKVPDSPTDETMADLQLAVRELGKTATPKLIKNKVRCRRATLYAGLRRLYEIGEYNGFGKRPKKTRSARSL